MLGLTEYTGKKFIDLIQFIYGVCKLSYSSFIEIFKWKQKGNKIVFQLLLRQILFTGIDALPMISIISLLLGTIVIIQSTTQLPVIGGEDFIGNIIVLVIIRELGPLITAIVIIGRSGSAIGTELGMMCINQEIEALKAMGIEITRILVLPRILGCVIATLCLTIYFDLSAILGGYIISRIQLTTPFNFYLYRIVLSLQYSDIFISLMKSVAFGVIIAILSCFHGLGIKQYSTEVPQATTKAVISSIVVCFLFSSAMTMVFYLS